MKSVPPLCGLVLLVSGELLANCYFHLPRRGISTLPVGLPAGLRPQDPIVPEGRQLSVPDITLIIFNALRIKKLKVLVLKILSGMMLNLVFDVPNH